MKLPPAAPGAEVIYLTGAENPATRLAAAGRDDLGILAQPGNAVAAQARHYPAGWACDNGCFAQGDRFDLAAYLDWLAGLARPRKRRCHFATAPDVMLDARATWERSAPVLPRLRALGYPAAFVAQDGIERTRIPWDAFDVLFLGGSTEWKLSRAAEDVTHQAKMRRKWVHMGRVNSRKRLRLARDWGCDSADGTYIKYGPDVNLRKLLAWLDELRDENAGEVAMLRDDAAILAGDARRAGLAHVRCEKEQERDKASWVVRASGGIRLTSPAALARYIKAPLARVGIPAARTPGEQGQFFDAYAGRYGHYTSIEEQRT